MISARIVFALAVQQVVGKATRFHNRVGIHFHGYSLEDSAIEGATYIDQRLIFLLVQTFRFVLFGNLRYHFPPMTIRCIRERT